MPMYNSDWESALRTLQPGYGGVARPAPPGTTGNIAYAPGMMQGYQGQGPYGARSPGTYPGGQYQPPPGGGAMPGGDMSRYAGGGGASFSPGFGGGGGLAMSPAQGRGFLDALRRMIAARGSVAATRGGGLGGAMPRPGYGGGIGIGGYEQNQFGRPGYGGGYGSGRY